MNWKITYAFVAACCLAVAITVIAQGGGDTSANIQQLETDMHHAQMNSDVAWYQQHLADGYVEGHSWGDWATEGRGHQANAGQVHQVHQRRDQRCESGDIRKQHRRRSL